MANTSYFQEDNLQALLEKVAKAQGFQKPTYSISNGSKPGQNFIGRVFRVAITEAQDEGKRLSVIFKASSTNQARQEMINGSQMFRTEKNMYETVFPTLNSFLKKRGVADHDVFPGIPRCLATEMNDATKGVADVVVLEDKKVDGFQIVDLKTGLNGDQCRLALKRVALLHSTCMALQELEPESAERLKTLLSPSFADSISKEALDDWKQGYFNGLGMLEEPFKPGNPTYDNLYKIGEAFTEACYSKYERPEEVFSICHNDLTSQNIMFKLNEDGSTEDACLIDFQTCEWCNIGNDLSTLLLYCTTKETRDAYFEDLLQYYFDEVQSTLRAFGCDADKVFPWPLFQKYLHKSFKFGLLYSIIGLPVLFADASEMKGDIHSNDDSPKMFTDTAEVKNPETIKKIKKRMNDVIGDAARWGYI